MFMFSPVKDFKSASDELNFVCLCFIPRKILNWRVMNCQGGLNEIQDNDSYILQREDLNTMEMNFVSSVLCKKPSGNIMNTMSQ